MQKIVEFKSLSFWTCQLKLSELDSKVESLNRDGWTLKSVVPNVSIFGSVRSYTLFLEK